MKGLVLLLLALAAAKLGYQEHLFRAASTEVIVGTHGRQAIAACQKQATVGSLSTPADWANPASIRYRIGNPRVDVGFWQVSDDRWNERFRLPFLLLAPARSTSVLACTYNLVTGTASLAADGRI